MTAISVLDAIRARRSIRSFAADPVDAVNVHALLDAAVHAPTAMHAEPWLFAVIQDRAALKRYSDCAKSLLLNGTVHHDLHALSPTSPSSGFLRAVSEPAFNIFYDAGTLILICGRSTNAFVAADCWLAAQNLMLAAPALGLGTCCIGSALAAVNTPAIKDDLGIPSDVTVFAAIIVGVPAGPAPTASAGRKEPLILSWKAGPTSRRADRPSSPPEPAPPSSQEGRRGR